MAERKHPIFEYYTPGRRLGRTVRHDGRSLAYPYRADGTKKTVRWDRDVPVFDQGDLGSCTGNATAGVLGSNPFYPTIKILQSVIDEAFAVEIYEAATILDDYPGQYPPVDSGSDGLSAAKAAKNLGLISGYTHILSIDAAYTAIQSGPFITGVSWYSGMDEPDEDGMVKVNGYVRGGHEFEIIGYDADKDVWEAVNSWGTSYGKSGHFFITGAGFQRLLSEEGDATVFVPIGEPAPTPIPIPTPNPNPTPTPDPDSPSTADENDKALWEAQRTWVQGRHSSKATKAVAADLEDWAAAKGLE